MTSEEFAQEVALLVSEAQARIRGVGAEQYDSGDTQRFEILPYTELFRETEEELLDGINYLAMLLINLRRLKNEKWAALHLWQLSRSCPCADADSPSQRNPWALASASSAGNSYLKPTD